MHPVLAEGSWAKGRLPAGYRYAGSQAIRVDLAEKIFRAAFEARAKVVAAHPKERNRPFRVDLALAVSVGLEAENARRLLGSAGFRCDRARPLPEGAQGAPAPDRWYWRPRRPEEREGRQAGREDRRTQHRKPDRKDARPAEGQARREGQPQSDKRDNRPNDARKGKPGGCPPRDIRPPLPKPDTGPARAGGAFDKLADLLKG
jgi:ATP-dependent RNA helicase SUPV3L1/SUV3